MSESCDNGSVLDLAFTAIIAAFALYGLFLIFPLSPGAVLGWELAKHLGANSDVKVMIAMVGAGVNYGVYQLLLWNLRISGETKGKVLMYLISILVILCLNFMIDNRFLQAFTILFSQTLIFFADPTRWFTGIVLLDIPLAMLYIFVGMLIYTAVTNFLKGLYRSYKSNKNLKQKTGGQKS